MKKKSLIFIGIFIGWALIFGSYIIDSPIYSDFVSIIFVIASIFGVGIFLAYVYAWIKNLFNK